MILHDNHYKLIIFLINFEKKILSFLKCSFYTKKDNLAQVIIFIATVI